MTVALGDGKVDVTLRESRIGQRRAVNFAVTVRGQTEQGGAFEERTTLRDLSVQGAYLCLNHRPRLQSELRVVLETDAGPNYRSVMSLRGTVVHREPGQEKDQVGVGIVFIEEQEPGPPHD